jgi:hypothetical protein
MKYFAEKVSPAVHDVSAKKEGFGVWKEAFMGKKWRDEHEKRMDDARNAWERVKTEVEVERKVHDEARGALIIKLFAEKVAPLVYDAAMRKEGFGGWKEEYLHRRFAKREEIFREDITAREEAKERLREEHIKEHVTHTKTRSAMMIKYFSEKISPAVHDGAARKEAFGGWKEQFMRRDFGVREEKRMEILEKKHEGEVQRRTEETKLEHKLHTKSRSDMIIKFFSETVSPAVHDVAAKREGFGDWKEDYMRSRFIQREEFLKEDAVVRQEEEARLREETAKEHKIHTRARSLMMIKYSTAQNNKILLSEI